MFGAVVDGMDVVRRIESVGNKSGKTSREVRVMDCGVEDAELAEGPTTAAARELARREAEEEARAARESRLPGYEDPDAASARRLRETLTRGEGGYRGGDAPEVRGGLADIAGSYFEQRSEKDERAAEVAGGDAAGGDEAAGEDSAVVASRAGEPSRPCSWFLSYAAVCPGRMN